MMRGVRRLLCCLVVSLSLAPAAGAQTATMQPSQLAIGTTDRVTFTLAHPAGRWTVTAEVPPFVAGNAPFGGSEGPLDPWGSPFAPAGSPSVTAGATASGGGSGTGELGNLCRRGFGSPLHATTQVNMPAGGGSLAWGFWLSKAQRWSATDYRVTFLVTGADGRSVRVRPSAPAVSGRFGTRFRLAVRSLPRGVRVVSGTTQPPLRRARVGIMAARSLVDPEQQAPSFPADYAPERTVAEVRTDGAGRFRYRWRPRRGQHLAVWVGSYESATRRGDRSCWLRIDT